VARVVEQHQRVQAVDLGFVGHEIPQQRPQSQRLPGHVAPLGPGVPLVEDQINHGQHGRQAVGQLGVSRHAEGDAGVADLLFGPHQPLRHGGLRGKEGPRDFVHPKSRHEAQGQCHLGVGSDGRVAAGEDERQAFVGHTGCIGHIHVILLSDSRGHQCGEGAQALHRTRPGLVPSEQIDGAVAGRRDHPCARICRHLVVRPSRDGGGEGILHRVFGQGRVAGRAGKHGHRPSPLRPEDLLDASCPVYAVASGISNSISGRTSMVP
jgi:hypothetical protein